MIWQNPLAWFALIAVAVPVIIHLLGRRSARVQRFPTLRFLNASRLIAPRRTRLSDLLLLLVRAGVVAAAVAGLAQPLWMTPDREASARALVARAIVVDTSASMSRATASGEAARDVARREAAQVADSSSSSVVVETADVAGELAGAVAWLGVQSSRRELVVVSDFQAGAVDSADVARVPAEIGVRLVNVAVAASPGPIEARSRYAGSDVVARVSLAADRTSVEWTARPASAAVRDSVELLAGARERARAEAARRASRTLGAPASVATHPIAIVFASYEQRAEVLRNSGPLTEPWMGDVVARVRRDATLADAAARADVVDSAVYGAPFVRIATDATGRPVVVAARASIDGRERLLFAVLADAGSLASAALISAVTNALGTDAPVTELEPAVIPAAVLASWQRATPASAVAAIGGGESDGRWFWLFALVLLSVEMLMRRRATNHGPQASGQ